MNYKRRRPRRPSGRQMFIWVPPRKRERQTIKRDLRRQVGAA